MNKYKLVGLVIIFTVAFVYLYKLYARYTHQRHTDLLPDVSIIWAKQPIDMNIEAFSGGNNKILHEVHLELTNQSQLLISQKVLLDDTEQYTYLIDLVEDTKKESPNLENLDGVEVIKVIKDDCKLQIKSKNEYVVQLNVMASANYNKVNIYFTSQREAERFIQKIQP
jgi:3D (Asp-Asp-Asp) domain-containing protein